MAKMQTVQKTAAPAVTRAPTTGIQLDEAQKAKFDGMQTKSDRIRFLSSLGYKNGPIAKFLSSVYGKEVRYQHVRNVLKTPLKKVAA